MRILEVIILALCSMMTTGATAQEATARKPSRTALLTQLHSDDAQVRSEAFSKLRSDKTALGDPNVKSALIDLLDRENREPMAGEEEDYAEYVGWLTQTVTKVVNWEDPHQVCILATSVDIPEQLAEHPRIAVPCLMERIKSVPVLLRGRTVGILIQALAKGGNDLDPSTKAAVQQVISNALHDPDSGVRIKTVKALAKFGNQDVIPALSVVAENDPDPSEGYAIRKWAAEAITAIQKRTGPQQ